MSDVPPQQPPQPEQTTVVGYPGAAQPSTASSNPGIASLRTQVSVVRYLVIAALALLLVIAVSLGIALSSTKTQLDDLSAQVTALGEQAAAAQQQAAAAQQSPDQAAAQAAEPQGATQLGASPELPSGSAVPAGADSTGAILVGDPAATDVVEVYIDYQCPFCQKWESDIGEALVDKALEPGSGLLVKQYNLAFLGETSSDLNPAGASARAASAAACVLHSDGAEPFTAFSRLVFATADPSEPPGQFPAEQLVELASQAGASDEAIACINDETYVPFVAATTATGFGRGVGGTPTVLLNGRTLDNPFTDADLLALAGGQ
jgi:protein-disulfide isomerase